MNLITNIGKTLIFHVIICLLPLFLYAQSSDTEGVKKRANEYFQAEEYQQAKELYSQLVSLYPRDENYNYRFGACMLYVDSDKNYPLKFLEYAVSKPNVDAAAYYYLGLGYHYNYQFDKAIVYFEKYMDKSAGIEGKKLPAKNQIRHCKNGRKLMTNIKNPHVLNVAKVSRADFFAAIKVRETGAKLLYAPTEFHSSVDKKMGYTPVMYSNKKLNVIFFSSYGKSDKTGLDLYMVRINGGDFSEPMKISTVVNTSYDDAFAYLSNDGKTFFFASKGHNSMGGYDLFQCYFDSANNSFTQPVNLDYVINTPDDDFMYAELPDEEIAYFASNRNSDKGKAFVYKVALNSKPFEFAVVDGAFKAEKTNSVKITIQDLNSKTEVGSFSSNKKDGKYVLKLESGGKYNFLVEPYGSTVAYQGRVDIPKGSAKKVLRQEIEIVSAEGQEDRLVIRNLFEEGPQENDAALLAQMYAEGAELSETPEPNITATNSEIVLAVAETTAQLESELEGLKKEAQVSLGVANQLKEEAQQSIEKAEELAPEVSLNDVTDEGKQKQQELNILVADAKEKALRAESAVQLYQEYQELIDSKEKELNSQKVLQSTAENASATGDRATLENIFEKQNSKVSSQGSIKEELLAEEKKVVLKGKRALMKANVAKDQQRDIEADIKSLKAQKNTTKKKKEQEAIQLEIDELEKEIPVLTAEQEKYMAEASKVDEEHLVLKEKIAVAELIESGKDQGTPTAVSTNVEVAALTASIAETIKEIYVVEEEVVTDSKVQVSGTGSNSELGNNNLADNQPGNEAEESPQSGQLGGMVGNELVAGEQAVSSNDSNDTSGTSLGGTQNTSSEVADETKPQFDNPNNSADEETTEEVFAYTEEYEEPSGNEVVIDGQEVPLDITSNTGKKRYSVEELSTALVVLNDADYNKEYVAKQNEIVQKSNGLEKAKLNQQLQYNWVVDMEKERAELLYAASQTDNKNYAAQLSNKASDMEGEIANKRNFLALNARIIKQLENSENQNPEDFAADAAGDNDTAVAVKEAPLSNVSAENDNSGISEGDNSQEEQVEVATGEQVEDSGAIEVENQNQGSDNTNPLNVNKPNEEVAISQTSNETNTETAAPPASAFELVVVPMPTAFDEVKEDVAKESAIAQEEVNKEKGTLNELNSELLTTKKKKDRRALAAEIEKQEYNLALAEQEQLMLDERAFGFVTSQASVIEDPTGELPSVIYAKESTYLANELATAQVELDDLQNTLSETKKKKKRQVLTAQIENAQRRKDSIETLADIAAQTVVVIKETEEHTLKTATPFGTQVVVELPNDSSLVTAKEASEIKTSAAYVAYMAEKKVADKHIADAEILNQAATDKMNEARALTLTLEELELLMQITPENDKPAMQAKIDSVQTEQQKLIKGANVYYTQAKAKQNEGYYMLNMANKELLALPNAEERMQIVAVINNQVQEENNLAQQDAVTDSEPITEENVDVIPAVLNQQIFAEVESSNYSDTKPIPVDVKLPSGVVLKVQVGAFRNQISQETFKGFAPIVGERTSSGLTRYTAGLFTNFEDANTAKTAIRGKGYSDAFVVAYFNGERISIARARQLLSGDEDVIADNTSEVPNNATSQVVASSNVKQETVTPVQAGDNVSVSSVRQTSELFFTVQVGVYNNRVDPNSVFSISPLNTDVLSNGLIRYSAGKYSTLAGASQARNVVRASGISDAFVTAYFNGERITIARAKELLASQKVVTPTSNASTPTVNSGSGKKYYLQVGPYTGDIDVTQATVLLEMNKYGIKIERNSEGTFYKIGNFNSQNEANALKQELVSRGVLNPKIVESENN